MAAYLTSTLPHRAEEVCRYRAEVAMARKNYVVLARVDPADRLGLYQYMCHELAHYWTGSAGPFTADHWMSESFAEYASALFLRERFGAEAFGQQVAEYERVGRGHGAVWTPAAADRPSHQVMYRLGPYVLSRLEERIGEAVFAEFIRRYMVQSIAAVLPESLPQSQGVQG